mgnify:CR=1 FL=1
MDIKITKCNYMLLKIVGWKIYVWESIIFNAYYTRHALFVPYETLVCTLSQERKSCKLI